MNILAATTENEEASNQVYNVALNHRTSLNELFYFIQDKLKARVPELKETKPIYRDFRAGDVRHSQANIAKAEKLLGYQPSHVIDEGLEEAMEWYVNDLVENN